MPSLSLNREKILVIILLAVAGIFVSMVAIMGLPGIDVPVIGAFLRASQQNKGIDQEIANFLPAAQKGDKNAQFSLALRYERRAESDPQYYSRALYWFRKSAAQWHSGSLNDLANMYMDGHGVDRDMDETLLLYTMAASPLISDKDKRSDAECNLCVMYMRGDGVPVDDQLAPKYCLAAANHNRAFGQVRLGVLYAMGIGLPQDWATAAQWEDKAAKSGDPHAKPIFTALEKGIADGGPSNKQAVMEVYKAMAENGFEIAQVALAGLYLSKQNGTQADLVEGVKWLAHAAKMNNAEAQYDLGYLCETHTKMCGGPAQAYKWLSLAANQNFPNAAGHLAKVKGSMSLDDINQGEHLLNAYSPPGTE